MGSNLSIIAYGNTYKKAIEALEVQIKYSYGGDLLFQIENDRACYFVRDGYNKKRYVYCEHKPNGDRVLWKVWVK